MVAPFWDAEHGGEEVRLLFFSPPPPFGGNLLVGRNPFFEIPFAGLPPTFEAGFRCWGTITKVFATSGMRNRLGHTSAREPIQNKSLKRRNPKYQSIPKPVWSKVYCNDIWGCGRGNYGGPRQLRVLAWAQFCDSLLAPVVREACNGTEAASCHSFMT